MKTENGIELGDFVLLTGDVRQTPRPRPSPTPVLWDTARTPSGCLTRHFDWRGASPNGGIEVAITWVRPLSYCP